MWTPPVSTPIHRVQTSSSHVPVPMQESRSNSVSLLATSDVNNAGLNPQQQALLNSMALVKGNLYFSDGAGMSHQQLPLFGSSNPSLQHPQWGLPANNSNWTIPPFGSIHSDANAASAGGASSTEAKLVNEMLAAMAQGQQVPGFLRGHGLSQQPSIIGQQQEQETSKNLRFAQQALLGQDPSALNGLSSILGQQQQQETSKNLPFAQQALLKQEASASNGLSSNLPLVGNNTLAFLLGQPPQQPPSSRTSSPGCPESQAIRSRLDRMLHVSKQSFPERVYFMLEEADSQGHASVISFVNSGTAFRIHDPRHFETDVMPLYFTSHRMTSFQRQLNIYGFTRIAEGPLKGAYVHEHFVQGKKDDLVKIKRCKRQVASGGGPGRGKKKNW